MNHFMGIEKGLRPLSVYGFTYGHKTTFWVPSINSNYKQNDFVLRLHVIKTYRYETNRHNFQGLIRHRVFACKNDMIAVLQSWLSQFANKAGKISTDIRFVARHNVFSIENWLDNKCVGRLMVT